METQAEKDQGDRVFRIAGTIFVLVAIVLAGASFLTWRHSQGFAASALRAEGTVVDLSRSRGKSQSDDVYYPVVTYSTAQGEAVEFISSWGSRPAPYRRGDKVTVLYEAATPQEARIESFFSLWGATLITGFIAVVFGILGGVFRFVVGRKSRKSGPAPAYPDLTPRA